MEKRRKELIAEKMLENEENENNEEDSAADIEEEVDAQLEDEFPVSAVFFYFLFDLFILN